MKPIQIPTGMNDPIQIADYVKRKLTPQMHIIEKMEQATEIPQEPIWRQRIEIPGDDWTTATKGMSGHKTLLKTIKNKKQ